MWVDKNCLTSQIAIDVANIINGVSTFPAVIYDINVLEKSDLQKFLFFSARFSKIDRITNFTFEKIHFPTNFVQKMLVSCIVM